MFHSDGSVTKKGFEATWKEVAGVSTGEVSSPGHPGSYPNSETVVKTISVPEGSKIELTLTALSIEEEGGSCPYDHLTIYDGSSQNNEKLTVSSTTINKNSFGFQTLIFVSILMYWMKE